MKKSLMKSAASVIAALTLCLSVSAPLSSAEKSPSGIEYTPRKAVVVAVGKEDDIGDMYWLSDNSVVSQLELSMYSGEKSELEYGDIINVHCLVKSTVFPAKYEWSMNRDVPKQIDYIGKAADIYNVKKLTLVQKNFPDSGYNSNGRFVSSAVFEDENGERYFWKRSDYASQAGEFGYKIPDEFDFSLMNEGDVYNCAVNTETYFINSGDSCEQLERNAVVVPVEKIKTENGDLNSDYQVNVADLVIMQKYLSNSQLITDGRLKNLDLNGDGILNVFDTIILRRKIIGNIKNAF